MKTHLSKFIAAPVAAIIALAGCGESEPEVVGGMADPNAGEIEDLDPAELPPMRVHSASYRCADNSVVYVTYYTNDSQVGIATEEGEQGTIVANEANVDGGDSEPADPPRFSGDGYTLVGTGDTIRFGRNGRNPQRCSS